jgi:Domain of unknown function (DUF4349)
MQKKISSALLLAALVFIGTACANESSKSDAGYGSQSYTDAVPPTTEASEAPAQGYEEETMSMSDTSPVTYKVAANSANGTAPKKSIHSDFISSSAAAPHPDTSKKFIRTADMRFRVADVRTATLRAEAITKHFGGWVTQSHLVSHTNRVDVTPISADSSLEQTFYTVTSDLTLRVPYQHLDTTIKSIARLIEYLDHRTIGAEDILLKNLAESLKQKRNLEHDRRLREAVDNRDSKLGGVADVEGARLQAQINADQALLNQLTLADKVEYSVVTVHLYQREAVLAEVIANHKNIDAYRPGFFSRVGASLATGWSAFLDFLVALISVWPVLLLIALVAGVAYWKFFRKKA